MTASPARPAPAPRGRRARGLPWRLLGFCAEAALFLLFTSSDACELPPPFDAMELVGDPKPFYDVGEKITYRCKKGYMYMFPLLMVTTCEPNHTWFPISDHGCVRHECDYLQNIPNGRIEFLSGMYQWGSQLRFVCIDGYYIVGSARIDCVLKGDDAYWTDKPPRCEKIFCTPPPKIQNGNHTFTDIKVFNYKEAVIYSCDPAPGPDPFSLIGESLLYCSGHNTWSRPPPECKVVKCPFPELENGKQITGFAEKYLYQATVMFECEQGFYMNGSDTATCNANSTWEPPIPECLKGPKPTHPTKPPVYNYPGYPHPREGLFDQELDIWIIALIVIISIVGFVVVFLLLKRCLERRKKGKTKLRDQLNRNVSLVSRASCLTSTTWESANLRLPIHRSLFPLS